MANKTDPSLWDISIYNARTIQNPAVIPPASLFRRAHALCTSGMWLGRFLFPQITGSLSSRGPIQILLEDSGRKKSLDPVSQELRQLSYQGSNSRIF